MQKTTQQRLIEALESLGSYALSVRGDRQSTVDGNTFCLQTLEWVEGLHEEIKSAEALLTEIQKSTPSGTRPENPLAFSIGYWLLHGETGVSSKVMAAVALMGEKYLVQPGCRRHPSDAPDLQRCVKLVEAAPDIKASFPVIRTLSHAWAAYIDHWDELTVLAKEGSYETTTARMRELAKNA